MPDVKELGQRVKAKYPGQYDDMDDAEVGRRTKAKYPSEYADFADAPERSVGGFVDNFLTSAGKQISGLVHAATNPAETYRAVEPLISFASNPGSARNMAKAKKFADALIADYGKAYGGWDATMKTLYEDPVRALGDVSMLAGGAGAAAKAANLPRVAKVASAVERGAAALTPVGAAVEVAGSVPGMLDKTARKSMQSALKPQEADVAVDRIPAVIQQALEDQAMPTMAGVQRAKDLTRQQTALVDAMADANTAKGMTVQPEVAAQAIDEVAQEFAQQSHAGPDLRRIAAKRQAILREAGAMPPTPPKETGLVDSLGRPIMSEGKPATPAAPMSFREANDIKRGDYRQNQSFYRKANTPDAEAATTAAYDRGIRAELDKLDPLFSKENAKLGSRVELDDVVERAARRAGNHDITGFGDLITAAGGATLGGPIGGAQAVAAKKILMSPAIKARAAHYLYKAAQKTKTPLTYDQARTRAANLIGRLTGESEKENPE